MYYIDPHIHMVSRITDDYETLAKMGCVAMSEPAFWAGFDRGSADGFRDYFRQLTEFEPKRAAAVRHPPFHLALHQRQGGGERPAVPRGDRAHPRVSRQPSVLGIGEIGLNKNTRNEVDHLLRARRIWPMRLNEQILIHTPHLEDKYKGTRMILDMLGRLPRARSPARAGRSRRGAHDPPRARRRLSGPA